MTTLSCADANSSNVDNKQTENTQTDQPSGFVLVEGGSFQMGNINGDSDEKPVRTVTLDDFYMSKTEVTVGEFKRFVDATKYRTEAETSGGGWVRIGGFTMRSDAYWNNPYVTQTDNHPVVLISWSDAIKYCNWLSEQEGLTLAYTINGTTVVWNREANGYRLPSEAEWEFAARGGNLSEDLLYSGSNNIDEVAWYDDNSNGTHIVGMKQPNPLGLYDMSGNVWEWCWDWYSYDYPSQAETNPKGASSGPYHVIRGSGWTHSDHNARSTNRYTIHSPHRYFNTGFRVVRSAL